MPVTYIVNELMCYVFHKYNSDTHADLLKTLLSFYTEEDVLNAKTAFHEHYEPVIGTFQPRQNRGVKTLKEKHTEDILEAMKKLDESGPDRAVEFCAVNLTNLPPAVPPDTATQPEDRPAPATVDDDIRPRLNLLEIQMAELLSSRLAPAPTSRTTQNSPPSHTAQPSAPPLQRPSVTVPLQHPPVAAPPTHRPAQPNYSTAAARPPPPRAEGRQLPLVEYDDHGPVRQPHAVGAQWQTMQRRRRQPATFGKRNANGLTLKGVERKFDFVVFNVPKDTTCDTIKTYIVDSGVEVVNISRLSKEDWNNQSFQVTVAFSDQKKVSDSEFWPENIGYRGFYRQRKPAAQGSSTDNNNGDSS